MRTVTTNDGVVIGYSLSGRPDRPAVVLCHGICASGRQFEADAEYFASLGYRVVVPDLRGHGRSGAPAGKDGDFSIARLAADMQAVLDDVGIRRAHWLGNSLGGIVGLGLLHEAPERFISFATFGTAYRLGLPRVAPRLLPLLYQILGPPRLGRIAAAFTTEDIAARKLIAEMIASFDPGAGERIAEQVRAYDLAAAAQQFSGPVLIIRGARDRAVNLALSGTFAAMAAHPDFQRIDFGTAGHCANLDVPVELRAALDGFWRRAGARPVAGMPTLPRSA
jgi:pimeloyl-ACP methyl ester carboxylesterase